MIIHIRPRRRRSSAAPLALASAFMLLLSVVLVLQIVSRPIFKTRKARSALLESTQTDNGLIIVTVANWMYREFLANFACNLRNLGVKVAPVVYALDRRTVEFAGVLGLSSVFIGEEEGDDAKPGHFERYGPRSFNAITKTKLTAVLSALRAGLDVVLTDSDVFWCRDATLVLKELIQSGSDYEDADVIIQPEGGYRSLNSGFYYARTGKKSLRLFKNLMKNIQLGAHDQDVVNRVFCSEEFGGRRIQEEYSGVPYLCESHGAIIRLLPSAEYPSGAELYGQEHVFKKSREELKSMCNNEVVVIHNNFIRANKKKARFVQKGMWFVRFEGEQPICMSEPVPESPTARRTCGNFC